MNKRSALTICLFIGVTVINYLFPVDRATDSDIAVLLSTIHTRNRLVVPTSYDELTCGYLLKLGTVHKPKCHVQSPQKIFKVKKKPDSHN